MKEHYFNYYVSTNSIKNVLNFCIESKGHYTGNLYYIKEGENIYKNLILLDFDNVETDFSFFINNIILKSEENKFDFIRNEKINESVYDSSQYDYDELKKCFNDNDDYKKELDFFNDFKNNNCLQKINNDYKNN